MILHENYGSTEKKIMIIEEIKAHAQEADLRLSRLYEFLKIEKYKQEMAELEGIMARTDFWDDKEKAQETVQKLSACKNTIEPYQNLVREVEDFHTIAELAGEDESFLAEADGADNSLVNVYQRFEGITWYIQFVLNSLYSLTQDRETCTIDKVEIAIDNILAQFLR